MNPLTPRQKEILGFVIEAYIATSVPIGSRTLAQGYSLSLSSASVRHEMGILEELGYLTHPHTSAGRIPTDRGYQFYVREVVKEEPVPTRLADFVSREMEVKIESLESVMEQASRVLSAMAEEAVLVATPCLNPLYLKELNLVPLDDTRLVAVWCSTSGLIQSCLVEMGESISEEDREHIQNLINQELAGEPLEALADELSRRIQSRQDSLRKIYERTLQVIQESIPLWSTLPKVIVEGSRYILNQPEFHDLKKLQLLMKSLEEKSNWVGLLTRPDTAGRVRVAIGEKELSKEVWDCSFVTAPYFWGGRQAGALGVLGPRRMPYGRVMGLVHHMAERISQTLARWGS